MSTSRCFRQIQYRASRVHKRVKKIALYGVSGAVLGRVIGEGLLLPQDTSPQMPIDRKCYEISSPGHVNASDLGGALVQMLFLMIFYVVVALSCKAVEELQNNARANPGSFTRITFTTLGAMIGLVAGLAENIPELGEEPILPEPSSFVAGRF